MEIIECYYDESEQNLNVTFTINSDSDYYRNISLTLETIKYYFPSIIEEEDIMECDDDLIVEILEEYFKENEMPEEDMF